MRQIDNKLTRDKVAAELRRAILYGSFGANEELSQDRLAADLGVSKMPVREAIQILIAEGLVSAQPNRTPVVNEVSDAYIRDFFEIRSLLEEEGVVRAIRRTGVEREHAELRECQARAEEAIAVGEYDVFNRCNGRIHQIIWRMSGNLKLEQMLSQMWHTMHVDHNAHENAILSHHDHEKLIESIVNGDEATARAVIRRHVVYNCEKIMAIRNSKSQRRYIQSLK